jgi:hypothetical protein
MIAQYFVQFWIVGHRGLSHEYTVAVPPGRTLSRRVLPALKRDIYTVK